ncbi:hypothetical protein OJAV_G00111290 [Oryzias javanicus]|uniref:V-SNARE coiled-coil homology domain-containing protein n=1 Tax=Oryzias javanicus TaxID=123683 RepID=A0A3S2PQ43_ORYJA|nr:hypothetical protein OJAV_G00111290 [Oryzias javanicus]
MQQVLQEVPGPQKARGALRLRPESDEQQATSADTGAGGGHHACERDDKVLERDQKLSELDDRADALQAGASQFESSAAKLKNKYWWKNCKMMIIMGVISVIFVGVIFLYFFK